MMEQIKITDLTDEQISFQLILHSGNARSCIIQSLRAYKEGIRGRQMPLLPRLRMLYLQPMTFTFK